MLTDILKQISLFVLALFFLLLGFIGTFLPWSQTVQAVVTTVLLEGGVTLFIFGILFLSVGGWLVTHLLHTSRQRRYYIKSGNFCVAVDERLLDEYLKTYWNERFPGYHVASRVHIREDKRLHIDLQLPPLDLEKQKPLLIEIEDELKDLLPYACGYRKPFHLTATFQQ